VLALQLGPSEATHDPMLLGDGLMVHGVRGVLGYHGNELGRYDVLTGKAEGYRQLGNPNLWQLLNVRYFLTNVSEPPLDGAEKLVGPVKDAAGATVYLYSVPGENPAAWVAPAIVEAPDDVVLATILDPRFPVRSTALFDTSAAVEGRTDLRSPPKPLPITVAFTRYEVGRISLTLNAPAPGGSALVVSENYYPGWRAAVDGKVATVARADYTLIGIPLPKGARQVELTFDSAAYDRGKLITLVALATVSAITIAGLIADRRRRG
jgi:hypothetical protein